jgi:hypothetical protein
VNWGPSAACPGVNTVNTVASVLRPCSTARWTLVDRPPRKRPSAGSAGSPAGGVRWASGWRRAPAACWWARLIVESTDTIHSIAPASAPIACRPDTIAAHLPASCQARNSP